MIESTNQEIPEMNKEMENSFLQWVIFTAKGFVFSCGSKTFYREAVYNRIQKVLCPFFYRTGLSTPYRQNFQSLL